MKNYKIGVLGLSETRWLQTGQLRFSSGEQLLYSGHTEDGAPHTEGVALMLAPEAQRALIGWEPVNSRIITAKFITKKKDIKLNIIQCYAPTNDAEEEKKDDFYQQLQTVIDRGGAKDMTILMGDFNAKIGSDNTGYENTMGTHGLGQMNENGERFADFCALNQLVIGGSIFPHKRIHKATWRSPDHVTENQIDHICISRKFRRSWRDVRVMRGADVSSDHHLLATTLRLRLKRHTNANNTRTRYNVGLLRNTETQTAFRISLSNRFQPLQDLIEDSGMDIETQWEHSKKLWHDTCEEVLGKRKTQHKEWVSADTTQKLEVRKKKKTALNTSRTRRAKAKAQEEYTAADREVKRSTRKDKRDYIDDLANQAEEAAGQGNLKDLYQVTKKLAGKFQQTDKPVKDKNGHPLTTTEEQLKRWAEHFRELLNRPIPETPPDIPPAETELPINCDKPSKAEIRKAIMTLRNGKAAGPDEIPAEAIKADTETAVNMLHSLFSKIWEKEEVPAQWKEGIVIKLPKKGDLRDCSNYRGIMLLSVPGKGGTDRDVTAKIGKARAAMVMLKNIWASKVVSIRTKLRIFNSNVKSVLLYGCETWRTTKTMQQKIQTFLNTCLRRIFNIRWPEKIRNEELWERAGQEPAAKQILRRKWGWIGHTLRKPASSTTRQALTWNPQGKRKRGRPRNSWRRDTEAELYKQGTNWTGVARIAQNRVRWRRVVDGLCSTWSQGPK
nr:hypothetical protein BaRGS_025312 [Batillaria attramentaria]